MGYINPKQTDQYGNAGYETRKQGEELPKTRFGRGRFILIRSGE
jgi:hypothetical protein